ncbi:YwmB family TATA-box binding protein [Brevibacillus sp. 7WMA2]|uniref:YwmB family TATA-box binding protein n=1 Tax=Brevibacillus TaxID=55080 RepID=UPI0013A74AEC|nr:MULTISPECIES: YwmB family TATA-box binding protein [Brevibacillus]MCR8996093.1 YwmB family TATA-box binding protein [Brevibacillus laterosporus]QIC06735.1 YwmB family TATA-box binding protein [Brevibacillus sp. 7WMA2]WPS87616.1 YwmB family TATA-box binding protein [Brevibacillus halotolerans]
MKKHISMVYVVLLCIGLFVASGFSYWTQVTKASVAAQLIEAAEATEATITDIEYRTSIQLATLSTATEFLSLGHEWSGILGIPSAQAVTAEGKQLIYQTEGKVGQTKLHIRLIGLPEPHNISVYLVISLEGKRIHAQDMERAYEKVVAETKRRGLIPQFSTCIRGIYNDTLSDGWQEARINKVFALLQAQEVERLQDESVTSISGFTAQWKPYIITNDQKMNVQVATHVDSLNQLTRITLGTPIITAEY